MAKITSYYVVGMVNGQEKTLSQIMTYRQAHKFVNRLKRELAMSIMKYKWASHIKVRRF